MNNTIPVLAKIIDEKIPILFSTFATVRYDYLTWFETVIDNTICLITKGSGKYSPIHLTIEYIPSNKNGCGKQAITKFDPKWFLLKEDTFKEFKERIIREDHQIFSNPEIIKYNSFQHYISRKTLNPFAIIQNLVTYKEWQESKQFFTKFMENKIGFEIDEDIFYYFLDVVPPLTDKEDKWMANGEPYDVITINRVETKRYISFHKFQEKWYYSGLKTEFELKEWSTSCKKIEKWLNELKYPVDI